MPSALSNVRFQGATVLASQFIDVRIHRFQSVSAVTGATVDIVLTFQLVVAIVIALFVAYNVFHYVLFLLVTQPKDASKIGHELNQFEQRQTDRVDTAAERLSQARRREPSI